LKVVSQEAPGVAKVGVFFNVGTRDETAANNGTAQLVERLAFKGTSSRKQKQLEAEVEALGATLSSCVGQEQSCFILKSLPNDLAKGVEILGDIVSNTSFDAATFESEKKSLLKKLAGPSAPCETVFHYLHATAYQGSSLGLGSASAAGVSAASLESVKQYVSTNHVASRAVLVATGPVSHDAVVRAAEQFVGKLPTGSPKPAAARAPFTGSEVRVRDDLHPHAHYAIAVEGAPAGHEDHAALLVASAVAGNFDERFYGRKHLAANLAQEAVVNGLAHRYSSFYNTFSDTGLWGLYAVTGSDAIDDFVHEIQNSWLSLVTSGATNESGVTRARNAVLSSLASGCALSRMATTAFRTQSVESSTALAARVADVSPKDVRDVMEKYVFDKCPAVSCFGPIEQFPDYNRLRSGMYWTRM